MDVAYINPFIVAVRSVFDKMVHLPVILGKPYLREHGEPQNVVAAKVELKGSVAGCIAIGFSQKVALALASGISGQPFTALDTDCIDALKEIASMISGNAKKDLPADGLTTISIPEVVLGANHVTFPTGIRVMAIPCHTPKGRFVLEVAIHKQALAAQAS